MIGASPSMEMQARLFLRMHLNLWVSLSQQHTTKMWTCIMISLQADPSLPSFISWTSSLSTGIPRSKLQSKQLHMEVSTSQQGPVSTKSWIYEIHCDTLAFQSETWATCLETTNRLSTAPLSHTPSCIKDTCMACILCYTFNIYLTTLFDVYCMLFQSIHCMHNLPSTKCTLRLPSHLFQFV